MAGGDGHHAPADFPPPVDTQREFVKREPKANLAGMMQLLGWLAEGKIRPHISARYALADTPRALEAMAARKVTGKVIVKP